MDIKGTLHEYLQSTRALLLSKTEGLSEYDLRRPLVPSGTNLLGLLKHLSGLEYNYLGECFGRVPPEKLAWVEDGTIWDGADMWPLPSESSEYLIGLYRRACAFADETITTLDLDTPGTVAHWAEGNRDTTLGVLLVRMVDETAHHAGHADIVRELIDGQGGSDAHLLDAAAWTEYYKTIQQAAETFR